MLSKYGKRLSTKLILLLLTTLVGIGKYYFIGKLNTSHCTISNEYIAETFLFHILSENFNN